MLLCGDIDQLYCSDIFISSIVKLINIQMTIQWSETNSVAYSFSSCQLFSSEIVYWLDQKFFRSPPIFLPIKFPYLLTMSASIARMELMYHVKICLFRLDFSPDHSCNNNGKSSVCFSLHSRTNTWARAKITSHQFLQLASLNLHVVHLFVHSLVHPSHIHKVYLDSTKVLCYYA